MTGADANEDRENWTEGTESGDQSAGSPAPSAEKGGQLPGPAFEWSEWPTQGMSPGPAFGAYDEPQPAPPPGPAFSAYDEPPPTALPPSAVPPPGPAFGAYDYPAAPAPLPGPAFFEAAGTLPEPVGSPPPRPGGGGPPRGSPTGPAFWARGGPRPDRGPSDDLREPWFRRLRRLFGGRRAGEGMSGVLTGALGGARALLVGWFVPSLINLLVFAIVVVPRLSGFQALTGSGNIDTARSTVFILVGTTVLGLALAALQTPLYRVLEGYLGWPKWLFQLGRRRELASKHLLGDRLNGASLALREGALSEAERGLLEEYRRHVVTGPYVDSDARKGPVWLSLLAERLSRFPADDGQVIATRLGNAIRRFEEYGYNRFRLDSQVLWHELNATVPEPARKQAEDARMNVDFFVCLLYGNLLVAASACVELGAGNPARPWLVAGTIIALPLLACVWYRVAIVATDDWAGAVRAMVNLGRLPLTAAMGLALPQAIGDERAMWELTVEFVRYPYSPRAAGLDVFRQPGGATGIGPCTGGDE